MDLLRPFRRGRRRDEPSRETQLYPRMMQIGMQSGQRRDQLAYKPTPRNLRYFAATPYARRAINVYKNSITQLDWEIVVRPGYSPTPELSKQMEIVKTCFDHPNHDDDFSQFLEQLIEDYSLGAAAAEMQIGGDPGRPLWMWPVDGLSIQIYPMWDPKFPETARYVQIMGYGSASAGYEVTKLRDDELMYVRPNPTTASPFGTGMIEIAFNTITRQLGVANYAGNISSNQSPGGLLWMGDITAEEVAAFRQYWKNDIEGQGRMPISGGGEKKPEYLDLHPAGDSALYLKYQDFLKNEIAVASDLSPQNFGIERDVNRNTAEVAEDRDMFQAIAPCAKKIGRALTRDAIHARLGFYGLEFRFKGVSPEDHKEDAEVFQIEYKNNAETPNGYRARKGRPPLTSPWADLMFADMQVAMEAARGAKVLSDASETEYDEGPTNANIVPLVTDSKDKPSPTQDRISTDTPPRRGGSPKKK